MARKNIKLGPFPKGKNNVQKETSIPSDSLNEALNVDINDDGKVERRRGYQRVYTGTNIHSFYSDGNIALFVEDGTLKKLDQNLSSTTNLDTGFSEEDEVDYLKLNNDIFYSTSGGSNGRIKPDGSRVEWGLDVPGKPTLIATSNGNYTGGTYQIVLTFVDEYGEESGAGVASQITLSDGQGISITNITQNSNATSINVYSSNTNGTILYLQHTVPYNTTSINMGNFIQGDQLLTQFTERPPAGQFIEHYNGRVFIADDNILWWSEPFRYSNFNKGTNYIEFPEKIKFVKSLSTGIYVGSDVIYFVRGDGPENFNMKVAYDCIPIHNTAVKTETTLFNFENIFGRCVYFWSNHGAMIGIEEGSVIPITSRRYLPDDYEKGTTYFKQDEGKSQLVTSLQRKGHPSSIGITDSVSAEVIRHGVVI